MHEDYCVFMMNLFNKSYARKASQANDGKTEYFPQQLCSERKDWDEDISTQQRKIWEKWRKSLHLLKDVNPFVDKDDVLRVGGVWERQIRSCRSTLTSLLKNRSQSLNDESFRTVITEVETIVNSRPLTVEVLSDSNSLAPLTPIQLLTSKTKIVMAPPGKFTDADMYSRRRWRRVQHLNEFWSRWRSEYLQSLQSRKKWNQPRRNFSIGDVVLLKDDASHRND